jgi:hypothetical protein
VGSLTAETSLGHKEAIPVTHLREMMLEELQRRNYAETTTRHYLPTVEDFSRRFNRAPVGLLLGRSHSHR